MGRGVPEGSSVDPYPAKKGFGDLVQDPLPKRLRTWPSFYKQADLEPLEEASFWKSDGLNGAGMGRGGEKEKRTRK